MSTSLNTRRYTPPTCTLEVASIAASDKPYFRLSFDDPRIPESQQLTITGDRQQLEQIERVVSDRLQQYLKATFLPATTIDNETLKTLATHQDKDGEKEIALSMQSHSAIEHQLLFKDSKIDLTTVQLFDLVTALEAYQTDIETSQLKTSPAKKKLLVWSGGAAVAVLAIALTAIGISNTRQPEPETNLATEPTATKAIPEFEAVVPPQVSENPEPTVSPESDKPISSAKKLPPPLPVDAPKPQPDIPDPANYPPPEPLDLSKLEPPPTPPEPIESTIEIAPETTATDTEPSSSDKAETSPATPSDRQTNIASGDAGEQLPNEPETQGENNSSSTDADIALNLNLNRDRLQQINRYFQERWQPPEQLKETIEYRLIIAPNGAIARIFPIGKASQIYIDRTNIPLMGETFIAPLATAENITVRLMLSPDGEVQTFVE